MSTPYRTTPDQTAGLLHAENDVFMDDCIANIRPLLAVIAAIDPDHIDPADHADGVQAIVSEICRVLAHHQARRTPWVGTPEDETTEGAA